MAALLQLLIGIIAMVNCVVTAQTLEPDSNGVLRIPDGTQSIVSSQFSGNTNIEALVIPYSLQSIGDFAFYECTKLANITYVEGSSLTTIGNSAFANTGIIHVVIPSGVESIGDSAFYESELESLTFHAGSACSSIGNKAFQSTQLNNVSIPYYMESLGDYAFANNPSLKQIQWVEAEVGGYGEHLKTLGASVFAFSGLTSILIPPSVNSLGANAFEQCAQLTTVTFPDITSLTTFSDYLFYNSGITSIQVPASITSIGKYCFQNVLITPGPLASVTFESNSQLSIIDTYAFHGTSLVSVDFPEVLTSVLSYSFAASPYLTTITWPSATNFGTIANNAFSNCPKLNNIILPPNINSVGSGAFQNCDLLDTVGFADCSGNPTLGPSSFSQLGGSPLTNLYIGPSVICDNCVNTGVTSVVQGANCDPTAAPTRQPSQSAAPTTASPTPKPTVFPTEFPTADNGGLSSGDETGSGNGTGVALGVTFGLLGAFAGLYYFFVVLPAKNKALMKKAADADAARQAALDVEAAKNAPQPAKPSNKMVSNPMMTAKKQ